jgi:hypothetical protein
MSEDYKIRGLRVHSHSLDDSKYRCIKYKGFLVTFSIATDMLGTQICFDGNFFGPFDLKDVEEGIEFARDHREQVIKYFRGCYLRSLKYRFSKRHLKFLVWRWKENRGLNQRSSL